MKIGDKDIYDIIEKVRKKTATKVPYSVIDCIPTTLIGRQGILEAYKLGLEDGKKLGKSKEDEIDIK